MDSRNPTHYLFPKLKTISEPKRNISAYNGKAMSSLVYEFNRTQNKASLNIISSPTALSWLKAEGPNTVIYPRQSDYCDKCSKEKVDIQRCAQSISRHLQSGSSSTEDFEELKKKRKIYKMMWKNTARLPENLCSTIVILKSDVTSNGAKSLSSSYPVVLLKKIKSFNTSEHFHFVIEC